MTDFYIGQINLFGFDFAPRFWAQCNGQLLAINQNQALFSLLGTNYGGNGSTTFALPDLRGRVPISQGQGAGLSNYSIGQVAGAETVTLTTGQLPVHTHTLNATTATGSATTPGPTVMLATPVEAGVNTSLYVVPGTSTVNQAPMAAQSIGTAGGSQPHENMMPYQALNYIIALEGIFPSRN